MRITLKNSPTNLTQVRVMFDRTLPPVKINTWHREEAIIREQAEIGQTVRIGIKTGCFAPLHVMHVILGLETIRQGPCSAVLLLPHNPSHRKPFLPPLCERYGEIQKQIDCFSPLFMLSDLKNNLKNPQLMELLRKNNADNIIFDWIASNTGKSGDRILDRLKKGDSLRSALDKETSPHVSKYYYYYYEENEFTKTPAINDPFFVRLIRIPTEFHCFRDFHSTQVREGKFTCEFTSSDDGAIINIEQKISP